jgi:hypothetical protein
LVVAEQQQLGDPVAKVEEVGRCPRAVVEVEER